MILIGQFTSASFWELKWPLLIRYLVFDDFMAVTANRLEFQNTHWSFELNRLVFNIRREFQKFLRSSNRENGINVESLHGFYATVFNRTLESSVIVTAQRIDHMFIPCFPIIRRLFSCDCCTLGEGEQRLSQRNSLGIVDVEGDLFSLK